MSSEIDRSSMEVWERCVTQDDAPRGSENAKLELNVIYTSTQGTLAALRAAGHLASNLVARINLLVPQVVPLHFPLTCPPVSISFTEQRLLDLACQGAQGPLETDIQLYLCRDRRRCLLQVLKPHSLVLIGRPKGWWPTAESGLAGILRSKGHQVIIVDRK